MTFPASHRRKARSAALILLTMSLGVLIAQIDTSVVNLALKHIRADLDGGVHAAMGR